ncbi:MAG: AI-2E family transporter [Gemmatimonadetes bacterium]|nr:AI-2E family transporter [Gemmatimonadota bacterium]
MTNGERPRGRTNVLLAAAAFVIVVAGLKVAAPILVPCALAGFIVIVTRPAVSWLQRRRVPTSIAITLVILLLFGVIAMFVSVATQSLGEIRVAFPRYVDRLQQIELDLIAWLGTRGIEFPSALRLDQVNAQRAFDILSGAVVGAAGIMTTAVLVLIIAIFGMIEANGIHGKLRKAFGDSHAVRGLGTVVAEVQHYLGIKTVISLVTGLSVGVLTWAIGLDFPVFWGIVAFLLNFVPNIGSIIAAIPAVLLALVQIGPDGAILTTIAYLAVNTVFGTIIDPIWTGRRLGLSTLVVMLSLVFWGWMWGAIGVLLAVPLTMIARVMLEKSDEYRWVAILLAPSNEPVLIGTDRHEPAVPSTRPADRSA